MSVIHPLAFYHLLPLAADVVAGELAPITDDYVLGPPLLLLLDMDEPCLRSGLLARKLSPRLSDDMPKVDRAPESDPEADPPPPPPPPATLLPLGRVCNPRP